MSSFRWCFIMLLFLPAIASSSAKPAPFHIKVLSAESQSFQAPPLVPVNCNFEDLNAYCSSSKPETYVAKTMVIQDSNGKSLKVGCTVYNQWSHCAALPVNQTFEARMEKRGLEISYLDQDNKMRTQLYEILQEG
ncbi:MAG: hypothetical protein WA477_26050 [Candidatus Sulfotelmatobacter sp.]